MRGGLPQWTARWRTCRASCDAGRGRLAQRMVGPDTARTAEGAHDRRTPLPSPDPASSGRFGAMSLASSFSPTVLPSLAGLGLGPISTKTPIWATSCPKSLFEAKVESHNVGPYHCWDLSSVVAVGWNNVFNEINPTNFGPLRPKHGPALSIELDLISAQFGPVLIKLGRFRPMFDLRNSLSVFDHIWANCLNNAGPLRSNLTRVGPNWKVVRPNLAQFWPKVGQVRPDLGDFGRTWPTPGVLSMRCTQNP